MKFYKISVHKTTGENNVIVLSNIVNKSSIFFEYYNLKKCSFTITLNFSLTRAWKAKLEKSFWDSSCSAPNARKE